MIYSVLIAIVLWTFVVYNQNPDSTKSIRNITTFYTNADALEREGLVILQDRNPVIDIDVKGRRLSLAKLDNNNISASITIPEMQPGTYDVPIDILLPIGEVAVTEKRPYTARIIVEHIKRIELPIEITQTGGGKNSEVYIKTSAVPEKIELWGPESVINRVASLQLEVNLDALPNERQNAYRYIIIDQNGDDISNNPNIRRSSETVTVLHTKYNAKNIAISVDYGNSKLPDGYVITKTAISPEVVLLGSIDESISTITAVKTAIVDISSITESTKLTVPLVIPNGIASVHDISGVEVSFVVEPIIERLLTIRSIEITNKKDNLEYKLVMEETFTVAAMGAESLLLNPDISAKIDVAGLEPGEYLARVTFATPAGVSINGSYNINVVVTAK